MFDVRLGDNSAVLLAGRLDAAQAPKLQKFLDDLAEPRVIDFGDLEYISSAGLGALLKTQKRVFDTIGAMKMRHVSTHIADVFKYSGLDQIFEIEIADAG
jgi:anti-anti-sigma factor